MDGQLEARTVVLSGISDPGLRRSTRRSFLIIFDSFRFFWNEHDQDHTYCIWNGRNDQISNKVVSGARLFCGGLIRPRFGSKRNILSLLTKLWNLSKYNVLCSRFIQYVSMRIMNQALQKLKPY